MAFNFYDLESLSNLFTNANFKPDTNEIDLYYLLDDPSIIPDGADLLSDMTTAIHNANKNFTGTINLFDLSTEEANRHMAKTFGVSNAYMINNPTENSAYPDEFRIVCDTDPDYDPEEHPFLMGYNSDNYDTTMLAMYFHEVWQQRNTNKYDTFVPTTAKLMREYNDELFTDKFKGAMPSRLTYHKNHPNNTWEGPDYRDTRFTIRKNMKLSGRHLDVAKLNEKQQKVALKRILGMLGYQILESEKLSNKTAIENYDELLDLVAYNVSDVVNLKKLMDHKTYTSAFILKDGLLKSYPELIYEKQQDAYSPNIHPTCVRRDRLTIDSSSAQFATKSLCPYDHLSDIPTVSFNYPHEEKAKELGIKQVNVLEECKKFFYANFTQPELRAKFDDIYNYYKFIEGKNFNESENYIEDFADARGILPDELQAHSMKELPEIDTNMFYYNKDGSPSSCFVNFSTGGIHGAEYNKILFDFDIAAWKKKAEDLEYVKSQYPDPVEFRKAKTIITPDGVEHEYKEFLKSGATMKKAEYRDLEKDKPELFQMKEKSGKKNWKINPKYVYTSADSTQHEDFTSYYPNLLRMMMAFYNDGLGYDRYGEVFGNKEKYGKLMKDPSIPKEERDKYDVLRNGTKLILNSASGAGDATFESNIRMNNTIISMRIIGQLFTWRIGQAQTIEGSKITSTNTDGLYSALEAAINNPILEREAKEINVEIEPEPTFLISKDSNNRIEMDPDSGKVISASGGSLSCRQGPTPTQSLAHPAIIDWALCEYLIICGVHHKNMSLSKPFDKRVGHNILQSAAKAFPDDVQFLLMFQNVLASSVGSINYVFATDDNNNDIALQHYNRVFIMKDDTPGCVRLQSANARKIPPATQTKRKKNNEKMQQHDLRSIKILTENGVNISELPLDKECIIKKVTNVEPEWNMYICNKDLHYLSDKEIAFIRDNLDYDKYNGLLCDSFEKNWRNNTPKIITITDALIYQSQIDQAEQYLVTQETNDPANEVLQEIGKILLNRDLYA